MYPAILAESGLEPAISSLAGRSTIPVEVHGAVKGRLPEPIELTAYFVVAEALTNVAKYAHASAATVRLARENGTLIVQVSDNGIGGADAGKGSGLNGLADRLAAVNGRLRVDSPEGAGTTLVAEIPTS
ncbi:MAG: sensor histidine kinase [Actinomycetota bacterium]